MSGLVPTGKKAVRLPTSESLRRFNGTLLDFAQKSNGDGMSTMSRFRHIWGRLPCMILGVDKLVAIIDAAKLNQTFHLPMYHANVLSTVSLKQSPLSFLFHNAPSCVGCVDKGTSTCTWYLVFAINVNTNAKKTQLVRKFGRLVSQVYSTAARVVAVE
jgi:hypothetical protein